MASAKAKTSLACDRCRQRKSRCDGTRPSCSHCVASGVDCSYRPTPTNLETDESVLSRLAEVETRLASLERSDEGGTRGAVAARPPVLHTASGHQILHSWPRIRVCLTEPGLEPLGFLEAADAADPFLRDTPETLRAWQLVRPAADFYGELDTLPAPLAYLFEVYGEFGREAILRELSVMEQGVVVELRGLTVAQLVVFSMALWTYGGSLGDDGSTVSATSRAAFACLKFALDKQWTLLTATRDRVVLALALAYGLVYYWARPFHALGLLQSVISTMKRWSVRQPDDALLLSCCKLYQILESDILTEIDEYASDTILSGGDSAAVEVQHSNTSRSQAAMNQGDRPSVGTYIESHTWLRGHQNRILHLYTPNKAYARPHELADLVARLSAELREWYHSQPLDRRFPRDATTFNMNNSALTLHNNELAIRYFSCLFFLYRPVLYFFLHRDMEYSIQPPNSDGAASDHDPWVLESCRDCIESAALIVQFCGSGFANNLKKSARSWCEYQLLFAAFLVILQTKGQEVFEPVFRIVGHAERLLDRVEGTFELASMESAILQQSLGVLRSVRQGFDASSPQYSR